MRGQDGGAILMGHGLVSEKYIKQKLNSNIFTETEATGMGNILPQNIWHSTF